MRALPVLFAALVLGSAVAPARADGPLDAVALRVRARDDLGALALLATLAPDVRASLGARYLAARLEERRGALSAASAAYAALDVAALPEPLRLETRLRAARVDARAGLCARARPVLLELAQNRAIQLFARALAGECALVLGDAAAAERELGEVFASLLTASDVADAGDAHDLDLLAVARLRADALVALRRHADAALVLRTAYLRAPAHPDAEATLARLVTLDAAMAGFDDDTRYALVAKLSAARAHDRALALLDAMDAPPAGVPRARYLHARGDVLFAMRTRYAEAARAFDEARLLGGPTEPYDAFFAARATSRAGQDAVAVRLYEAFAVDYPRDERATEARWLAAWLALREGGAVDVAQARMRAFVDAPSARADRAHAVQGTFLLAMDGVARLDAPAARMWLDRSCAHPQGELETQRCRYWLAYTAHALGNRDDAVRALDRLASDEPFEWYGLLARRRLTELGRRDALPSVARPAAPAGPSLVLPDDVAFLHALGFDEDAARHLRAAENRLVREEGGLPRVVAAYLTLGDASRAYRLARSARSTPVGSFLFAALHPTPLADVTDSLATRFGVDAAYVYGTMRQESAFDATAVSRVGAIGLLQLMPETGRRSAASAGLEGFDPALLFDPAMNIRLGMVEMRELTLRYRGSIALVAAAYNAGPAKVDSWRQESPQAPLDLFVERIPFDETRGYVRRVVSHTARFRALSGQSALALGLVENPLPPQW